MIFVERLMQAKQALDKAEVLFLKAPNAYMRKVRLREVQHFRAIYYAVIKNQ